MRMIDADALKDIYTRNFDYENCIYDGATVVGNVDESPTVDAEPVRHGKWIIRDNPGTGWYRITCSECGEDVTSNAPCIGFFPNAKVIWDYCPECGAKMDRKEEE